MGKQKLARDQRRKDRARAIDAFTAVAGQIFAAEYDQRRVGACLNATRVCIDALAEFGVTMRPAVVHMLVMNKAWSDLMLVHNRWPAGKEESDRWADAGAWLLAVGQDDEGGDLADRRPWPHHIVAVGHGFLIDASAGQANRPHRNIPMPMVLTLPMTEPLPTDGYYHWACENGVTVAYREETNVLPDNRPENMSGFQRHALNNLAVARVVSAMRRWLLKA